MSELEDMDYIVLLLRCRVGFVVESLKVWNCHLKRLIKITSAPD